MNKNVYVIITMTNVNHKCNAPIIASGIQIMWFACKQLCLNMEQVQVKSIMAVHLVFWVMLGVTRMRKYFPQSAIEFYRKEKLSKLNWSRLWPPLHEAVAQDTHHLRCIIAMIPHVILTM